MTTPPESTSPQSSSRTSRESPPDRTSRSFSWTSRHRLFPYEAQIEVESGDPTILQVFAQDNQSEGLDYTWTFEQGTENEIQFSGPQVIYEFDSEGPTSVFAGQNDAGLSSYAEILVIVTKSDESSGLTWQIIAALSVIALMVIAVASLFYYNNAVNRRMSELSEAEEEDESPPPPSAEMQAQMWGRAQPQSFQPPEPTASPDLDDEMLDILGASKPAEAPILRIPWRTHSRRPGVATRTTITG